MTGRWERMEALLESRRGMRRALTSTGPQPALSTPLDVPVVHKPDSTVWTRNAEGQVRCWHVEASGALHETAESRTWMAERGAAS